MYARNLCIFSSDGVFANDSTVRRICEETLIMTCDQGDEADWVAERDHGLAVVHANELQLLRIRGADGNNHASTFAQLREQSGRNLVSGSGDQNCVEGSVSGKTEYAVAGKDMDIGRTEPG